MQSSPMHLEESSAYLASPSTAPDERVAFRKWNPSCYVRRRRDEGKSLRDPVMPRAATGGEASGAVAGIPPELREFLGDRQR